MALVIGKTYYIKNVGTGKYLNVHGYDTVSNGRNVNTYSKEDCKAQKWVVTLYGNGARVLTTINQSYGLNIYTGAGGNNCTMWPVSGNDADAIVDFLTVNASQNLYRIKMITYSKYLKATGYTDQSNVYWSSQSDWSSSDDQTAVWQLVDASIPEPPTATPVVTTAPAKLLNGAFYIKNTHTGKYLNIYGNEQVSNERNVVVWSKEKVGAQKWFVRQKTAGAKICSSLDERYALNIYTPTNNCSIYLESGNDLDSVLDITGFDANAGKYLIKMANRESDYQGVKYLASSVDADGANVIWEDSPVTGCIWDFETEDEAFPPLPPAPPVPTILKGQMFFVKNENTGMYLNVHGYETVADTRNVNVYEKENTLAQKWIAEETNGNDGKLFTSINLAFALNCVSDSNPDCTMYTATGNDEDSVLEFEAYDSTQRLFRIKMHSNEKYLAATDLGSGANVTWESNTAGYSLWRFQTEDEAFPPAPAVPTEIEGETFFIRNEDTGVFLNVYGNESVQNTTNVTTYEAENALAQKWIARETSGGGKLFTALNSAFALNIVGVGGSTDCTMYTAVGNDNDSVLEFVPQGDMVYKIKMYNHNKYLTALTDDRMSNVYFDEDDTGYSSWRFMRESEVDFTSTGTIGPVENADSSLVTEFIPAYTGNYSPSREDVGGSIQKITIHHIAGNMSIESLGRLWQTAGRNGSSHYGVNGTQVGQYVKEDAVAWTDGNWESNKKSVTIEAANSTSAPNWEVSDTTLNTLIKLVADIARRNKLGTLVIGQNLTYHSMYSATACPGPYLLSKMQEIADGANAINGEYSIGVQEKIYLRKTGTDKYLGFIEKEVDGNETINEAAYVDKDLATGFLMTGENGIFTLCDFDNQNLKLQMRASDGKAILAGEEVENVPVFAEYNDDYNINIFCNNTVSQFMMKNSDVSIFKQFFSILEDSLGFLFDNKDDFGVVKVGESPVVEYLTGYVPENLLNKVVRIKYKTTGEYLNYLGENSLEIGIKNLIISNVESKISNQLFKIVQVGHKGYVITPVKDNNKSITVTYKNISTAETMDAFSNDYLISVFPKNDYYTIYFPQKNKYLSKGTLLGAPIAIGSSIENLWEIEEYKNYLTYPTKVMRISQRHDDNYSHPINPIGPYVDYPIDETGEFATSEDESKKSVFYCPCDEMEIIRIKNTGANTIWLKSTAPAIFANGGVDYAIVMVIHPEDEEVDNLYIGQKFLRYDPVFKEGSSGLKERADHFHISVGMGDLDGEIGSEGEWQGEFTNNEGKEISVIILRTTGQTLLPTDAFYMDTNFTRIEDIWVRKKGVIQGNHFYDFKEIQLNQ